MRLASYLDSQQSRKAGALIVKRGRSLGLLLYVAGLVYLCLLPLEDLSRKSFFDENALMAGLVKREFSNQDSIARFSRGLKSVGGDGAAVEEWLLEQLTELGLEVYTQNFTSLRPVSFKPEETEVVGRNLYAVLRAGRAHSTEAIVLTAPLTKEEEGGNSNGLAVMLALAQYFKTKNYWAKDLVFLVTTHGEFGAQAWINGYLGLKSKGIVSAPLPGRSGAIQAAISLELPAGELKYADLVTEGVNGILPNLDLVNVVMHLSQTEGVKTAFHVLWDERSPWYSQALRTVLAIGAHQSPGLPLGSHSLFLRHRIDALTLRGVGGATTSSSSSSNSRTLGQVARALEGVFRSVNNLLETLHHSEFFYFTASSLTFISLGRYMPPFALLLAPVIMEALSLWLQARNPHLALEGTSSTSSSQPFPFQAVVKLVLVALMSGVGLYYTPAVLAALLHPPLPASTLVAALWAGCGLSILLPVMFRPGVSTAGWRLSKSFSLILLLLALLAMSLTNFSLAVCMALALPLPSVLAQPRTAEDSVIRHSARSLIVLLTTPPLCAFYLCSLYIGHFNPTSPGEGGGGGVMEVLVRGYHLEADGLAFAYSSWHLVGSWLFAFLCIVQWSLWSVSWTLCCCQLQPAKVEVEGRARRPQHPHSD